VSTESRQSHIAERAFGEGRRLTPHALRHTWASGHLAAGTPLRWVQEMGGWASAKVLLSTYAHYLPHDSRGFADALSRPLQDTETAPDGPRVARHA
jgi:integrase